MSWTARILLMLRVMSLAPLLPIAPIGSLLPSTLDREEEEHVWFLW